MAAILNGGREVVWHSFEEGPPKGNSSQILIWFSSFNGEGLNVIFFLSKYENFNIN